MSKQEALPGACEYVAWEMPQPWKQPTQKELDAVEANLDALERAAGALEAEADRLEKRAGAVRALASQKAKEHQKALLGSGGGESVDA